MSNVQMKTSFANGIEDLMMKIHINGGAGADVLHGKYGFSEDILGGGGNDILFAHGRAGEGDRLFGGQGMDELHAGVGTVLVDGGEDILRPGMTESIDTAVLDFSSATKGVTYNAALSTAELDGGTGLTMTVTNIERIEFTGGAHADTISGTWQDDVIFGGGGRDSLSGSFGDDTLGGGAGADTLHGGRGADVLDGGKGADVMYGGADADTFILRAGEVQGDKIMDFQVGIDQIEFHGFADGAKLQQHWDAASEELVSGAWDVVIGTTVLETFYAHAPITDGSYGSAQDYIFV